MSYLMDVVFFTRFRDVSCSGSFRGSGGGGPARTRRLISCTRTQSAAAGRHFVPRSSEYRLFVDTYVSHPTTLGLLRSEKSSLCGDVVQPAMCMITFVSAGSVCHLLSMWLSHSFCVAILCVVLGDGTLC